MRKTFEKTGWWVLAIMTPIAIWAIIAYNMRGPSQEWLKENCILFNIRGGFISQKLVITEEYNCNGETLEYRRR